MHPGDLDRPRRGLGQSFRHESHYVSRGTVYAVVEMRRRLPALCLLLLLAGCQGSSCIDGGELTKLALILGGLFVIIIIGVIVIHND